MSDTTELNMLEYHLGLYLYSCAEALRGGTVVIHNTFFNGMQDMLDEWQDKYSDLIDEHLVRKEE